MLDLKAGTSGARKLDPKLASVETKAEPSNWFALALLALVLAATGVVFLFDRMETTQLRRLDADYTDKSTTLATAPYPDLSARVQTLDQARRILAAADAAPVIWSGLLKDFHSTTTSGIALGSLSIDQKGAVKLDGTAATMTTVAEYLATLRASRFYQMVELVSATASEVNGQAAVQFSISATLSTTALSRGSGEGA